MLSGVIKLGPSFFLINNLWEPGSEWFTETLNGCLQKISQPVLKKIIANETELVEVFNNDYINIVEKPSGKKSRHVARDNNIENKKIAIQVIKKYFENHPSIKQIQENFQHQHTPSVPYTTTDEVKKLLKEVNAKKA